MRRFYFSLILLLSSSPVLSAPLVTCEPDSFLSRWGFSLLGGGYLSAVAATIWHDYRKDLNRWVIGGMVFILALALAVITLPVYLPLNNVAVLNKDALYSAPEVQQGLHYRDDCARVAEDESTLEFLCRPDAVKLVVPREKYTRALEALSAADKRREDLELQLHNTRICSDNPVMLAPEAPHAPR